MHTMKHEYKTTRIWLQTLQNLKRIAAETGESLVSLLDRLARAEWDRVKNQSKTTPLTSVVDTNHDTSDAPRAEQK